MNKVVEFIHKYKQENPSGWKKWIFGSLAALGTLLVIVVFAIRSAFRAKEMAKLAHERDVAKEEARQALVNACLETERKAQQKHLNRANTALNRRIQLDKKLRVLTDEHERNTAVIDSIRSWDDVDRIVK